MKLMMSVLVLGAVLAGCTLMSPPPSFTSESSPGNSTPQARRAPPPPASSPQAAVPGQTPAPMPPEPPPPQQQQFALGAAATALVDDAHTQEQSHNFGLAAQTLERALSIEPRNPLVWIELGRENILAGNPAQAYGMGRKAVYLATGDAHAQASAWQLIAASLRAQGRNDEAYVAEEKAVALNPN